jgi:hypothetical protein
VSTSSRSLFVAMTLCVALVVASACKPDDGPVDGGTSDTGIFADAMVSMDADVTPDAAPIDVGTDAAIVDSGVHADAMVSADGMVVLDADVTPDAEVVVDAAVIDAGADPDAGFANACQDVGGICVSNDATCTGGNGVVLGAGAAGCVFDDGPGTCCAPPAPAQEGSTCELHGGLCAPISGCNFVHGAFAEPSCNMGPGTICCVPESQCGPETQECCDPSGPTTFRTACDFGTWTCIIPNTQLRPIGMCP